MLLTVLEITALLVCIIMPLAGPAKKAKKMFIDTDVSGAKYAINADGRLEMIPGNELSKHEH